MSVDRDHKLEVEKDDGDFYLHVVHPDTCPCVKDMVHPVFDMTEQPFEVVTHTCGIGNVDNFVGISLGEDGGCPTTAHDTEGWAKLMAVLEKWATAYQEGMGDDTPAMPIIWEESGSYDPFTGEYDHEYVWVPFELEEYFA